MTHPFVRTVVHVHEIGFPIGAQRFALHGITVVLRSDETAVGAHHAHRLVVRTVTILQFVDRCACSFREQLVAHADAHAGTHLRIGEKSANVFNSLHAGVGIAGAVGQKQAVELQFIEVVVPRHANHFHTAVDQATNDVVFHTTVHQNHFRCRGVAVSRRITHDFLATYFRNEVNALILSVGHVLRLVVEKDFSHHHPVFTEHFGEFTRVDARNAGHFFALQPFSQTFFRIPMRIVRAVVADNDRPRVDAVAFHKSGQPVFFKREGWHTIVAHQRVSEHHKLSGIGRIGEALGIARHGRVENNLTGHGSFVAEALSVKASTVAEQKGDFAHVYILGI